MPKAKRLPVTYLLYWRVYVPRQRNTGQRITWLHRLLLRWGWHLHPDADPIFRRRSTR